MGCVADASVTGIAGNLYEDRMAIYSAGILIYYLFTFAFVDPVLVDKEKRIALLEKTYYLILLCVFMFLYLMMSFTFLA